MRSLLGYMPFQQYNEQRQRPLSSRQEDDDIREQPPDPESQSVSFRERFYFYGTDGSLNTRQRLEASARARNATCCGFRALNEALGRVSGDDG